MTAEKSSFLFALIGLGSLCGAVASGVFARLIGTSASLLANYLLGASAVAIVLLTDDLSWISLSAFILGFFLLACGALSISVLLSLGLIALANEPERI